MNTGSVLAQFNITLSVAVSEPVQVDWFTSDGTAKAGVDYAANKGAVVFAPGETAKVVDILVYGRAVGSQDRSFFVEMLPPTNAILGASIGECIITVDTTGSTPVTAIIVPTGPVGPRGKSAYQSYLDTTTDNPPLSEVDWVESLKGDPAEIAQEVAGLIDVGATVLTSEGTETLPTPDGTTVKAVARRVAYADGVKIATMTLAGGDNLVSQADMTGDAIDLTGEFYPRIHRSGVFTAPGWDITTDGKLLIKSAIAGDELYLCQYDFRAAKKINTNTREQWKRILAEVGINLVDGSFERGATAANYNDAVWHDAGSKCYIWGGILPKIVSENSSPGATGGIGDGAWIEPPLSNFVSEYKFGTLAEAQKYILRDNSKVVIGNKAFLVKQAGKIKPASAPIITALGGKELSPVSGFIRHEIGQDISFMPETNATELTTITDRSLQGVFVDAIANKVIYSFNVLSSESATEGGILYEYEFNRETGRVGAYLRTITGIPMGHSDYFAIVHKNGGRKLLFSEPAGSLWRLKNAINAASDIGIAIYGDSTTDGYNTTGWTQNPVDGSGNAIGGIDHNPTAPNAWPNLLNTALRTEYGTKVRVYNAGYTQRSIVDSWAFNNADAAIINNSAFSNVKFVMIAFGLNDVKVSGYSIAAYKQKYRELVAKFRAAGIEPIVVTSDPVASNSDRPDSIVRYGIVPAQRELADELGLMLLDMDKLMRQVPSWQSLETDGLHFNDAGHASKSSYAFAAVKETGLGVWTSGYCISSVDIDASNPASTKQRLLDFSSDSPRAIVSAWGDDLIIQRVGRNVARCSADDVLNGIYAPSETIGWSTVVNMLDVVLPEQNLQGHPENSVMWGLSGYDSRYPNCSWIASGENGANTSATPVNNTTKMELECVCFYWRDSDQTYQPYIVLWDQVNFLPVVLNVTGSVNPSQPLWQKVAMSSPDFAQWDGQSTFLFSPVPVAVNRLAIGGQALGTVDTFNPTEFIGEQWANNSTRKGFRFQQKVTAGGKYTQMLWDESADTVYGQSIRFTINDGTKTFQTMQMKPGKVFIGAFEQITSANYYAKLNIINGDGEDRVGIYLNSSGSKPQLVTGSGGATFGATAGHLRFGRWDSSTDTFTQWLDITQTGYTWNVPAASARELKENFDYEAITGLSVVRKYKPLVYTLISDGSRRAGFIADENHDADPYSAHVDEKGKATGIWDHAMIAQLVKSVQQLDEISTSQALEIEKLKQIIQAK